MRIQLKPHKGARGADHLDRYHRLGDQRRVRWCHGHRFAACILFQAVGVSRHIRPLVSPRDLHFRGDVIWVLVSGLQHLLGDSLLLVRDAQIEQLVGGVYNTAGLYCSSLALQLNTVA